MRHVPALPALIVLLLALPPVAAAQDPAATAPAPAPARSRGPARPAKPAPEAASGSLTITPEKVGGSSASVLAGTGWRVRGTLTPYVADQRVAVRFYRGGKKILVKNVRVLPSRTGKSGYFLVSFRANQPSRITVRATHRATAQLKTVVAKARTVDILPLQAKAGSRGQAVRVLQHRLSKLGYVVGQRGLFDGRTGRAVMAFRKNVGMARNERADREVFRRLAAGQGRFRVRYPSHGRHVEANISKQVLALIGEGGKVERIYPTSTGAPATPTILGSFRVYRKDFGTNSLGMVHSSYFIRGYAIHGYHSVPAFNASHGCLRVPVPDALSIWRWVRHGTRVDTYR